MPKSAAAEKRVRLSEADVQKAVVQMLELDGWRSLRTDPVSNRAYGKGFGEIGMPDMLFIRYKCVGVLKDTSEVIDLDPPCAQVLWIEFKAPGKQAAPHQRIWITNEQRRGALVVVFDSLESAREWYKTSGLMRTKWELSL